MESNDSSAKSSFAALCGRVLRVLGARLLVGLIAAFAALIFFGWLAEEVFEGAAQDFDNAVRLFVHNFASPAVTELMRLASFLGSTLFLVTVSAVALAAFYFAKWRRASILFAVTMLGAIVLNFALKSSFQRTRPEPYFDTPLPSSFSFPSGHALFAVCFYGVLARLIAARIKNRRLKIAVWAFAVFMILAIGVSRIYLGVHYPSDVAAGYAAAFVWVFVVALGDFWIRRRGGAKKITAHEPR